MQCPACSSRSLKVICTADTTDGQIVRRRHCQACSHRWYTLQPAETDLSKADFRWIERGNRRKAIKLTFSALTP